MDSSWSDGQGPILQAYPFCESSTPEKKKKKKIHLGLILPICVGSCRTTSEVVDTKSMCRVNSPLKTFMALSGFGRRVWRHSFGQKGCRVWSDCRTYRKWASRRNLCEYPFYVLDNVRNDFFAREKLLFSSMTCYWTREKISWHVLHENVHRKQKKNWWKSSFRKKVHAYTHENSLPTLVLSKALGYIYEICTYICTSVYV
jgi:hypothetical protein